MGFAACSEARAGNSTVQIQTCDRRCKRPRARSQTPQAHVSIACGHLQPVSGASSQPHLLGTHLLAPLIHHRPARRLSASTGSRVIFAFQSRSPAEQSQQLQPLGSAPKFQPFTPQTGVRQDLLNYRYKVKVANGSILVRPLTHSWVHACGGLLTGAFADAMGYVPMYRTYLRHQIRQYLYRHADMPPKAVVLVALLMPEDDTEGYSSNSEPSSTSDSVAEVSTSGQEQEEGATLVGTVELSFAASTRARYLTLNAPVNCAYLCNMAVDANYRRRGYGNILLDAADDITKIAGEKDIFLHLRFQDAAPASLYKQAGYVSDKADSFLVRLLGLDRRYLMKKQHG